MLLEDLIFRITLKDFDALKELYNETRTAVYSLALSILNNREEAEDAMQDTYVNIHKYAYLYQSKSKPLAWILTITKNICFIKLKKNKRTFNISEDIMAEILKTNHNYDNQIFINYLLNNLTSEERKIVILHLITGFKFNEIAKVLNLKLPTILSKYHRAIKKLRTYKEV